MTPERYQHLKDFIGTRNGSRSEVLNPGTEVKEAVHMIQEFQKGRALGGLTLREMIKDGRRF